MTVMLSEYLITIPKSEYESICDRIENLQSSVNTLERRLIGLAENVPGMIYQFTLETDGTMLLPYISSGCEQIYEVEAQKVRKNPKMIDDMVHPADKCLLNKAICESAQSLQQWELEWRIITPSGREKWLQGFSKPELQEDDSILWYSYIVDITQRKQAEIDLVKIKENSQAKVEDSTLWYSSVLDNIKSQQIEAQYRRIFEVIDDSLIIGDLETGKIVEANPAACELQGYSRDEFIGLHPTTYIHPYHHSLFENFIITVSTGESFQGDAITMRKDGSRVDVDIRGRRCIYNGKPHYLLIVRDITLRQLAEERLQKQAHSLQQALRKLQNTQTQLVQSEKMSSLGQMVAGVAHEINNPINFIHGNLKPASHHVQDLLGLLELYQQYYPQPRSEIQAEIESIELDFLKEDLTKILKSMQEGTTRIREIVLSLRNFSRLDEADVKKVNIHEGIDSTLMILKNRLKAKLNSPTINIIKEYETSLPSIECYPGQLNQVFMNILVNGIDTLEDKIQNQIQIQNNYFNPQITINTQLIKSNFIRISITDNGCGIPENIQSKLFDPFFTTKEVGKGTGLGLSISYQVTVEKHRGKLYCYSQQGKGTEFVIEIPVFQVARKS